MVVLFGVSDVAAKLVNDGMAVDLIVDNNPNLEGSNLSGVTVKSYGSCDWSTIKKVIICATSISEIKLQLENERTFRGAITVAQPLLTHSVTNEFLSKDFTLLITSGLPSVVDSKSGGGLYIIEVNKHDVEARKIYDGNVHGSLVVENQIIFNDVSKGICLCNTRGELLKNIKIDAAKRLHGIDIWQDFFVVADSGTDSLFVVDKSGDIEKRFFLSEKFQVENVPQHHINDVCVHKNSVYVSMFSLSGNWRRGRYDGAIVEVDLNTGVQKVVKTGLTMPHSIYMRNGHTFALNSFDGGVLGYNFTEIGRFNGFARGLAVQEDVIIVAESRNRNFNRLKREPRFYGVSSVLNIINLTHGIVRSVSLPQHISEIHSVNFLD